MVLIVPFTDCRTVALEYAAQMEKRLPGSVFLQDYCAEGAFGFNRFNAADGSYVSTPRITYTVTGVYEGPSAGFWDQVNSLSLAESASILTAIVLCWVVGWAVRQALRVGTSAND